MRALVGRPHGALGEHPADDMRLLGVGLAQALEHLLLALMIAVDGERHELVQRHAVVGIDVEQLGRDGCKAEALLDDRHGDEEGRGDVLLGLALLAQRQKGPELIERMQRRALDVLGEAVFLGECRPRARRRARARSWPSASA